MALDNLGRNDEALASFDKSISINPNIAIIWSSKGTSLFKLGKYNDAISAYDKAISLDPT
jgi:tetratricopeptide (TPR) repeat protein